MLISGRVNIVSLPGGGVRTSHIKRQGCSWLKAVYVPLRVFNVRKSSKGALGISVRVFSRKIYITGDNGLF